MNQATVAALDRVGGLREIVCGTALEHRCRTGVKVDPIGQADQFLFWNRGVLGIGAGNAGIGHTITLAEVSDVGTQLFDRARRFQTQGDRQRNRIETGTLIGVDKVDAGSLNFYQDLTRTDGGHVHLFV